MTRAGRIHHLELYVGDLEASRAFWEPFLTRLGYRRYQAWEGGVSFFLEPTYLVLVEVEPAYRAAGYHRKRIGLNHLAFHAESRAQVDALTRWWWKTATPCSTPTATPTLAPPTITRSFARTPTGSRSRWWLLDVLYSPFGPSCFGLGPEAQGHREVDLWQLQPTKWG